MIKSIQRINLNNIIPHNTPKSTQLLLILTNLRTIGSISLLDLINKLRNLLPGRIQLSIDSIIVGIKIRIVILESAHLLSKVILLRIQLFDQMRFLVPDESKSQSQKNRNDYHNIHRGPQAISLLRRLFALNAL